MPFCPKCGSEYLPGVDNCADCGIALQVEPPPVSIEEALDSLELYSAAGRLEAETILGVLTENDIAARLRVVESSAFPDSGSGLMSPVHVVIASAEEARARELIDMLKREKAISTKGEYLRARARRI